MTDTAASGRTAAAAAGRAPGRPGALRPAKARARGVDAATLFGLAAAFALIAAAIVMGGAWQAFFNVPSLLIVLGGTFAVTTISFSLHDMLHTQKLLMSTFTCAARDPGDAARQVLEIAEKSRRDGLLSLQASLGALRNEPFLARGLALVVDGTTGKDAERVMRTEMYATSERQLRGAGILRRAAEVAPAMGLIGTLVGLVQMLGRLDDPATIGPAMAVALLTTLYGAVLGNMLLAPLAGKLEKRSAEEALIHEIYLLGVGSIGRQENPRRLELMINTLLPPGQRLALYR
jgi:chemotaxis protein MotA